MALLCRAEATYRRQQRRVDQLKEKVAANMLTVMVSNEGGSGSQVLLNIK